MNDQDRSTFTLSDMRAIRLLVLAMGGAATFMLLVTDRESPVMVVGFILIVTIIPVAAIYLLRRYSNQKKANAASRTAVTSVAPSGELPARRP